jgi:hypothetical protein
MTDTLTPLLDARHAAEFAGDEFTEAEMNAIDAAAVHVYKRARKALPSELKNYSDHGDPAIVLRQMAYQWAYAHPAEIHERNTAQIIIRVRDRVRDQLERYLNGSGKDKRGRKLEVPGGHAIEAAVRGIAVISDEKREKVRDIFSTTRPVTRPMPIKYKAERSPICTERNVEAIAHLGRIPSPDTWQFAITGRTGADDREGRHLELNGKSVFAVPDRLVWEDRARFEKLHTRRPTRAEYWGEMFNGNGHRKARKDLEKDTGLHADTVEAIADDVAPAVSERFSTGARPADYADVRRKRLEITSEEVKRALLEKFDVFYED